MRQTYTYKIISLDLDIFNAMEIMQYAMSIYVQTKKTYQHIDDFNTVTEYIYLCHRHKVQVKVKQIKDVFNEIFGNKTNKLFQYF